MTYATLEPTQTLQGVAGTASAITYSVFGDAIVGGTDEFKLLAQGALPSSAGLLYDDALAETIVKVIRLVNVTGSPVTGIKFFVGGTTPLGNQIDQLDLPAFGSATLSGEGSQIRDASGAPLESAVTLTGDATGTGLGTIATTVVQIQGRPVSASAPSSGQALVWTGAAWVPTTVVASATAADASITVGGTATAPTFATGRLDQIATLHPPTASVNLNSQKITSIADATNPQDVPSFAQVQAIAEQRDDKEAVLWGTTGNVTLSGLGTQANGEWTGALTAGDRILAKDQSTSADKGIYLAAAGAWTRALDANTGAEITNATVLVQAGATLKGDTWRQSAVVATIGTDPQTWVQIGEGDPITLTNVGAVANAQGASLAGQALTLQPASAAFPGLLTAAGFSNLANQSGVNTGNVSLTAVGAVPNANGASLAGQALTLQPADASFPGLLTAAGFTAIAGLGATYQPLDATLTALAGANWALNSVPRATGADTMVQQPIAANEFMARASTGNIVPKVITDLALSLLDDVTQSDMRTTLGLGTLATQSGTFSGTSSGTNTGDQTITLTGDVTGSGTGSFAATLASVIVAGGPTGSGTAVPVLTWDAKGRLLAVTTAATVGSVTNSDGTTTVSGTATAPVVSRAAITGDVSVPAASTVATLANTGPGATGPIGSSTVVPIITIDAKGRVTALTSTTITSAVTAVTPIVGQQANYRTAGWTPTFGLRNILDYGADSTGAADSTLAIYNTAAMIYFGFAVASTAIVTSTANVTTATNFNLSVAANAIAASGTLIAQSTLGPVVFTYTGGGTTTLACTIVATQSRAGGVILSGSYAGPFSALPGGTMYVPSGRYLMTHPLILSTQGFAIMGDSATANTDVGSYTASGGSWFVLSTTVSAITGTSAWCLTPGTNGGDTPVVRYIPWPNAASGTALTGCLVHNMNADCRGNTGSGTGIGNGFEFISCHIPDIRNLFVIDPIHWAYQFHVLKNGTIGEAHDCTRGVIDNLRWRAVEASFSAATTVAVGSNGVDVDTFTGAGVLNVAAAGGNRGVAIVQTTLGTATLKYTAVSLGLQLQNVTRIGGHGTMATGGAVTLFSASTTTATTNVNALSSSSLTLSAATVGWPATGYMTVQAIDQITGTIMSYLCAYTGGANTTTLTGVTCLGIFHDAPSGTAAGGAPSALMFSGAEVNYADANHAYGQRHHGSLNANSCLHTMSNIVGLSYNGAAVYMGNSDSITWINPVMNVAGVGYGFDFQGATAIGGASGTARNHTLINGSPGICGARLRGTNDFGYTAPALFNSWFKQQIGNGEGPVVVGTGCAVGDDTWTYNGAPIPPTPIVAAITGFTTVETIILQLVCPQPSLKAGMTYKFTALCRYTAAAGTAANVVRIRCGTAGTAAGDAIVTPLSVTPTAVNSTVKIEAYITVRTVNLTTGTIVAYISSANSGAAISTGFQNQPTKNAPDAGAAPAINAGFINTLNTLSGNLFIELTAVSGSTSQTITPEMAWIEKING